MTALLAAGAAVIVLGVVALATFASPGWPFRALGFTLGLLPFAPLPGQPGTLVLFLVLLCWCALAVRGARRPPVTSTLVLTGLLVVTGALSLVVTGVGADAATDFGRWTIATSVLVPVLCVAPRVRDALGRSFVLGATLAAVLGLVLLVLDPSGRVLAGVGVVGQDPFGGNLRTVRYGDGSAATRLVGVWQDPNVAGLMMTGALLLALHLLRGRWRVLTSGVLLLAITLTLSRAAFGTLAVGGLLLVLAGGVPSRLRRRLALLGVALAAGLLAVPGVLMRLRSSLGSSDIGARARWEALEMLPDAMAGHWLFGRGWGLPELIDGTVARVSNHPANASLLTLYRGGLLAAVVFTALLVVLAARGWRLLRRSTFEEATLGAGLLALVVVALQLDFPVVTMVPAVVLLGLLVARSEAAETAEAER